MGVLSNDFLVHLCAVDLKKFSLECSLHGKMMGFFKRVVDVD